MKTKTFVILALLQVCNTVSLKQKSKEEDSSEWKEYRATRGEHDCAINEN